MKDYKRIIVIEDDRDINELVTYNLRRNGFWVESCYDGIEAQKKLEQENFDIVILDIMLPGKDGFELCKSIKDSASAYKTAVIIISAKSYSQDKIYAHILGADYYLTKPFEIRLLLDVVREINLIRDKEFCVKCK